MPPPRAEAARRHFTPASQPLTDSDYLPYQRSRATKICHASRAAGCCAAAVRRRYYRARRHQQMPHTILHHCDNIALRRKRLHVNGFEILPTK